MAYTGDWYQDLYSPKPLFDVLFGKVPTIGEIMDSQSDYEYEED